MDNFLPDEIIAEICKNMTIDVLKNFVDSSARHHNICYDILQDKIEEQNRQHRLILKAKILYREQTAINMNQVLDVTKMRCNDGYFIRSIYPPRRLIGVRRYISGYQIIAGDNYDLIVEILNTH